MKSNYGKYYTHQTAWAIAMMFFSGTVLQAFLLENGVSEQQVYRYSAILQLVQLVVMFGSIFLSNRIKNAIKAVGFLTLAPLALIVSQFIIILFPKESINVTFTLYLIVSIFVYCAIGFKSIQEYRLPYQILPMEDYGRVCGVSAAISKFFCFGLSILYSALVVFGNYNAINSGFLIFSMLCIVLGSVSCFSLKNNGSSPICIEKKQENKMQAFKNKYTYILLLPNFFRGIATGIISALAVIGISKGLVNTQTSTYLNVINQIALLLGNLLFAYSCNRRIRVRKVMMISAILLGIVLPLSLARQNTFDFMVGYLFVQFFLIFVDTSIPVLVTEFIPYEEIGTYTAIRMSTYTFGSFLILIFVDRLTDILGGFSLMLLGTFTMMLCVIPYYFVARYASKKKKTETIE